MKDGKSDALPNLGLVGEEVGEIHPLEHLVDPLLEQHPHGADAAVARVRASLLTDRMRYAMKIERRELGGRNDIADGDLRGRTGERVPTVRAAGTPDDLGATKTQKDLLDVVGGQAFQGGDLSPGDRTMPAAPREVQRADDPVLGPRGNAHDLRIGRDGSSDKAGQPADTPPCAPPGTPISVILRMSRTASISSGGRTFSRRTRSRMRTFSFTDCLLSSAARA